ncbi:hypothetical protein GGX14DRAFT_457534 [Mycena pura]|uniref:Uncharacterized protein n=1 Tax=Mycena pura TaxID=153505 RepID=A0AAD6Y7V8_9AGAR|nr:hypothetical protein GGX14DRAFT_457534 [Mycena pura]
MDLSSLWQRAARAARPRARTSDGSLLRRGVQVSSGMGMLLCAGEALQCARTARQIGRPQHYARNTRKKHSLCHRIREGCAPHEHCALASGEETQMATPLREVSESMPWDALVAEQAQALILSACKSTSYLCAAGAHSSASTSLWLALCLRGARCARQRGRPQGGLRCWRRPRHGRRRWGEEQEMCVLVNKHVLICT